MLEQRVLQRRLLLLLLDLLEPIGPVHVRMEARGVGELGDTRQLGGRHDEARARECAGVVIQVDADDAFERMRDDLRAVPVSVLLGGRGDQALEPIDQEMARAARWIEQPHLLGAEGLDGGRQRAVQDKRAHEIGCLAEREAGLHDRIELLVQVAHQLALEVLLGEAPQRARVGVAVPPEGDQRARQLVGGQRHLGGLRAEQLGHAATRAGEVLVDPAQERRLAQVRRELLEELLCFGVEQPPRREQPAIFEHAHVDALEHPEHGRAAREQIRPHLEVLADALVLVKLLGGHARSAGRAHLRAQIGGDPRDVVAQRTGQSGSVGRVHASVLAAR